ncbi:MAG: hypothetical protein IT521_00655 [Burkholderiales bacterium]|nr:hypothetical protein [Burkholderiales bacterium]
MRRAILADGAALAACVVAAGGIGLLLGQDSNWDLRNYHHYNPWAWWNGRIFDRDVAPAQLQTFHNPLPDLPFYAMVAADWPPRAIAFVLAAPAGFAAFFLAKLLPLLFSGLPRRDCVVAVVAAFAVGVTSAMGVATLGTTMNEWPLAALTIAALWLLARALVAGADRPLRWTVPATAGMLCGVASGAKLTAATFAVALCVALALRGPYSAAALRRSLRDALIFGLAVLAGLALAYGPWGYQLWLHYASPVFPYGNEWIDSPWWSKAPIIGRRFGPHTLEAWLRFPFDLLQPPPFFATEVRYRDARMPVLYALALAAGIAWLARRAFGPRGLPPIADPGADRAWRVIGIFFIVSFLLWTAQHSNYRYLVTLDLLSGALIVALIRRVFPARHAGAIVATVATVLVLSTGHASWGRIGFGSRWFDVRLPELEPDALVVLANDEPMAYALPLIVPAPARSVGIANNIVEARRRTRLDDEVVRIIRDHDGPIYSLSTSPRTAVETLRARGLAKLSGTCVAVPTNMAATPLELCRVGRIANGAGAR